MMNIESYMNDGANWQAQCVLVALRANRTRITDIDWNEKFHKPNADINVGRFENCREQGYVFSLIYKYKTICNYLVYEHRNSDDICIKKFEGNFTNTPTIDDANMKDKWDYDTSFECGEIIDATDYIVDDMIEKLEKIVASSKEDN